MDEHELRAFALLSQVQHFGRSADQLNMSPSALSRMVQRIEGDLGAQLLIRDRRGVELTAAGQRVAQFCREEIDRWRDLRREITGPQGQFRGTVRLFASVTACYSLVPSILSRWQKDFPQVRVELLTGDPGDAVPKVVAEEVDLAIGALDPSEDRRLRSVETAVSSMVVVAERHWYGARREKSWLELWGERPIILPKKGYLRRLCNSWMEEQGLGTGPINEVSGNEAILALVQLGQGLGIVPRIVLENSPLSEGIEVVEQAPELPQLSIGLVALERRCKSGLFQALLESLATDGD